MADVPGDQPSILAPDEAGDAVRDVFQTFLATFALPPAPGEPDDLPPRPHYLDEIDRMVQSEVTTLYVDMQHVFAHERVLGDFIESEYYRFEPHLRRGLANVVAEHHREFLIDNERGERTFWIAFYNAGAALRIRQLITDKIGRLVRVSGTVTRTSEVCDDVTRSFTH